MFDKHENEKQAIELVEFKKRKVIKKFRNIRFKKLLEELKDQHPKLYSSGSDLIDEVERLLATQPPLAVKMHIKKSLRCAVDLLENPSSVTLVKAYKNAEMAPGKVDAMRQFKGKFLVFCGAVVAAFGIVCWPLAIVGGCLAGVGFFYYHKGKQQTSVAKHLSDFTTETLHSSLFKF